MEIVEDDDYFVYDGLEYEFINIPGRPKKKTALDMSVKPKHRSLFCAVVTLVTLGIVAEIGYLIFYFAQ